MPFEKKLKKLQWFLLVSKKLYIYIHIIPKYNAHQVFFGSAIRETSDGGYILCGYRIDGSHHGLLVKTDANGNVEWQRTIGTFARDVIESKVGGLPDGYVVVGKNFMAKVHLDPFNGFVWERGTDLEVNSVQQTSDEGYIVAGTQFGDGVGMKIDVNGNWQWSSAPDINASTSKAYTAIQVPGGYLIGGHYGSGFDQAYLFKVDNNGNFIWTKIYEIPSISTPKEFAISDLAYDEFGYLLNCFYPATIIRVKFNGEVVKNDGVSSSAYHYIESGVDVRNKFDFGHDDGVDGFVTAGGSTPNNLRVVKTNPKGKSGCDETLRTVTVSSGNETFFAGAQSSPTTLSLGNLSMNPASHSLGSAYACFSNTCTELTPSITRNCNVKRCPWECVTMTTGSFAEYLWSNGDETQASCRKFGTHGVLTVDGNDCWGTAQHTIQDAPSNPLPDAAEDKVILVDTDWQPGDPDVDANNDGIVLIRKNLTVSPGVTLTITDLEVRFGDESRVIVSRGLSSSTQGGRLILDNTTFTAYDCCSDIKERMWHGIQVHGYFNESQQGAGTSQGIVDIRNNSVVENARLGIAAAKVETSSSTVKDTITNNTFDGGVILAANSSFQNNGTDIVLMPYLTLNRSNFNNCSFGFGELIDPDEEGMFDSLQRVVLRLVFDVQFQGCTFINSSPTAYDPADRGFGIQSFGSSYTVRPLCQNQDCSSFTASQFSGLYYGVESGISIFNLSPTVHKSVFTNCLRGVLLNASDFATVTGNTFNIPSIPPDSTYGLYLRGSTGYKVEGNGFDAIVPGSPLTFGCIVAESGGDENVIYRNEYKDLDLASEALGINDGIGNTDGLQFRCNEYTNNNIHITVIDGDIGRFQGGPGCQEVPFPIGKNLAGNRFYTHNCPSSTDENDFLLDNTTQDVEYFHHSTLLSPETRLECYTPDVDLLPSVIGVHPNQCTQEFIIGTDPTSTCTSTLLSGGNKNGIIVKIDDLEVQIRSEVAKIDGGNTQALLNTIATQSPGKAKNDLINVSPLLSDQVLIAAINAGLPPGALKQILIASSPLTPSVLAALDNIFVPGGTRNQINSAQTGTSARETLELDISGLISTRKLEVNELIRFVLNDATLTIKQRITEAEAIFRAEKAKDFNPPPVKEEATHKAIACLVATEKFTLAEQEMTTLHQGNPDNECRLMAVQIALSQMPKKEKALKDLPQKEQVVRNIAADKSDKTYVKAENLLTLVYKEKFKEKIKMPSNTQNKMGYTSTDEPTPEEDGFALLDENHKLKCFPNPFSDFTTIEAFVPEGITHAKVLVMNTLGVTVKAYSVQEGYNALTVWNEDLPASGVYFYALYGYGKILEQDKLIIIK